MKEYVITIIATVEKIYLKIAVLSSHGQLLLRVKDRSYRLSTQLIEM